MQQENQWGISMRNTFELRLTLVRTAWQLYDHKYFPIFLFPGGSYTISLLCWYLQSEGQAGLLRELEVKCFIFSAAQKPGVLGLCNRMDADQWAYTHTRIHSRQKTPGGTVGHGIRGILMPDDPEGTVPMAYCRSDGVDGTCLLPGTSTTWNRGSR